AEDGIRDGHVTGVQTCALPIYPDKFEIGQLKLEEGVSCAACHGPYDDWYYPHANLRRPARQAKKQANINWRALPPDVKERDYGRSEERRVGKEGKARG